MCDLFLLQQHQISAQALKIFNEPKSNVESLFLKKRGVYLNPNCATCSKTMIIFEGDSHQVGVWGGVSIFKSIGTYILISTSKNRQIVKYLEHRQTTANKEIFLNILPIPIRPKSFSFMLKKNANTQKLEERKHRGGYNFSKLLIYGKFYKRFFFGATTKYVYKFLEIAQTIRT